MPLGEEYASRLVVKVDGSPLPPDVEGLIISAYVDDSVHVPSLALLRFSDEHDLVLDKVGAKIGSQLTVALQQSGSGGPVELIAAEITALEQEIDESGVCTTVRGLDVRHRLQSGATAKAFAEVTVSDVVKRIAQEHGISCRVTATTLKHKHIARGLESEWDFLRRLAQSVGSLVWVEGTTLCFGPPTTAGTAPPGTDSGRDAQVIEKGANLISLRATVTAAGQVPETEVRGWDPITKKPVVSAEKPATGSAQLSTTPTKLAQAFKGTKHVAAHSVLAQSGATGPAAKATAAARAGGFAEIEGEVRGNPALRAGTAVNLVGVGATFRGKYVLTGVRHEISPTFGYRTSFAAAGASDRSVYGVINGGGAADVPGVAAAHHGVLTAMVSNVKDPEQAGRVKVSFPVLSDDYESWWARPVQLGAGQARGTTWLPEVGDEVLVAFGQGVFDEPYVLGGLFNGKDKPAKPWGAHVHSSGTVTRRAFTSRTGMVVEFVEDEQNDTLTVATNDGKQHLTLTQSGQQGIVLVSQGPLEVTAEQDISVTGKKNITMTTQSGDFSLKAMNVTIEATQNLALKGLQLAAEGKTTAEVKGATVKVSAQASAELVANATTTIRGALVRIN